MQYIIIENIGTPIIGTDENGETLIFDSLKVAEDYCIDNFQEPIIVPLCKDLISIISDAYNFVSMAKFELGEEYDEKDDKGINTEENIGRLLN